MKKIQLLLTFITILTISFSSCKEEKEISLGVDLANAGVLSCERASEVFSSAAELDNFYLYNKEYLKLLPGSDSLKSMPEIPSPENEIELMIQATDYLCKVYREYNLLSDKAFNLKIQDFSDRIIQTSQILKKIDKDSTDKYTELIASIETGKYDSEFVFFALIELYNKNLEKNIIEFTKFSDNVYGSYKEALETIPAESFDAVKVANMITEPVKGDELITKVYKLQLIEKQFQKNEILKKRLSEVSKSFDILESAHGELTKNNSSHNEVQKYIAEINKINKQ